MIRKIIGMLAAAMAMASASCTNAQDKTGKTELEAPEFAQKMKENPGAAVLDVRTPGEFNKGHIAGAVNVNWKGDGFDAGISGLDKSRPVFIYCLSGGRSSSAAAKMLADGFLNIYELKGGMMKWRAAGLSETRDNSSLGISMTDFHSMIDSTKIVLVDFYADWCVPCQKMKPYLEEISGEMADSVIVIRINSDENPSLCKALKVDALPVLHLYNNKKLSWSYSGFIEKQEVLKHLHR